MTMDPQTATSDAITRHVVGQVINSIAARDWASLSVCVSPNIIYWRPGTRDRIDGVDAYIAEWQRFTNQAAQLDYRPHTVVVQDDMAVVEATAEGETTSGEAINFSMVTMMRVVDGRLVEEREYIVPRG